MKESTDFSYAGILSTEMGLINVTVDGGMFEEAFLPERDIHEERIRGRDKPYFFGIKTLPPSISLTFAFSDGYDENKIRAVARWLNQPYYQPFFVLDSPNRILYCMLDSSSSLVHNSNKEGYITVTMRCADPYSYSPEYMSEVYDLSSNTGTSDVVFVNSGDLNCKPDIWIEKVGNGDVSIINTSNENAEFKFIGILDGETIYVDNENEIIKSSIAGVYRYNNFNNNFLDMVRGNNYLLVYGKCKIRFRYELKKLQG